MPKFIKGDLIIVSPGESRAPLVEELEVKKVHFISLDAGSWRYWVQVGHSSLYFTDNSSLIKVGNIND